MIDINGLAERMLTVARLREQNNLSTNSTATVNLLKHLSGEVVEASLEYARIGVKDDATKNFQHELGDILCLTMLICCNYGFDIEEILNDTLEKNINRANKNGDKL